VVCTKNGQLQLAIFSTKKANSFAFVPLSEAERCELSGAKDDEPRAGLDST